MVSLTSFLRDFVHGFEGMFLTFLVLTNSKILSFSVPDGPDS